MMNTLLGVGIGYLIFKWAESEPTNTPTRPEEPSEPQDPAEPEEEPAEGVYALLEVSPVKQAADYPNNTYGVGKWGYTDSRRFSDGNQFITASYAVMELLPDADPSNLTYGESWIYVQGNDSKPAYAGYANKSDAVKILDGIVADDPNKPNEPEKKPPKPPSQPLPPVGPIGGDGTPFNGGLRGGVY